MGTWTLTLVHLRIMHHVDMQRYTEKKGGYVSSKKVHTGVMLPSTGPPPALCSVPRWQTRGALLSPAILLYPGDSCCAQRERDRPLVVRPLLSAVFPERNMGKSGRTLLVALLALLVSPDVLGFSLSPAGARRSRQQHQRAPRGKRSSAARTLNMAADPRFNR